MRFKCGPRANDSTRKVSRSTIQNVLAKKGIDTGPRRGESTWDEFLKRHAKTLWATDFFSVRTWTMRGLVDCYALVFIHVATRRVVVSPVTVQPDARWVAQQARTSGLRVASTRIGRGRGTRRGS